MASDPSKTCSRILHAAWRVCRGGQTTREPPRDVFLGACATIAARFAAEGFRYAKSRQRFSRVAGDFVYGIWFQSSHYNSRGVHVALWIHAQVTSPRLKRWRAQHPSVGDVSDAVGGGQIGNLVPTRSVLGLTVSRPDWLEWDLASPAHRSAQIDDAEAKIRQLALPLFAAFDDVPTLCNRLQRQEVPGIWDWALFDFLACFASVTAARNAAVRLLADYPAARRDYVRFLREWRQNGLPRHTPTGIGSIVAAASCCYGFGDLLPEVR